MKKKFFIMGTIFIGFLITFFFIFFVWVFFYSTESINRDKYINDFDLHLKGKVLKIEQNKYGQTLVCLEVIESNYDNYFPIFNPNEGSSNKDFWENRFFIKVQNEQALFIFENTPSSSTNGIIKKGTYVIINRNNNKNFEVFENENTEKESKIGKKIITYPIRDNIKNSCLDNFSNGFERIKNNH
ncbi:hypothetical protein [Cloacibacterium sp.]|uniref:hypothetical protein n=1 Tax=Cloacibacterium sp. TaxID=1913682 RepID=UPI0035AFD9FC